MSKYIFITGGVVSSLGKGIIASSIGRIFKESNYKVNLIKFDPYLNVDPGTMSPIEHGEVFVTKDGTETDLDLGHYERIVGINLTKYSSVTSGQIYQDILEQERQGKYQGKTIQIVPTVTEYIKDYIKNASKDFEINIIEIGGTVGDIESLPFLEALRQLHLEEPNDVLFIHTTLVIILSTTKEFKTKPTQHSIRTLNSYGINPHLLVVRAPSMPDLNVKKKLALFSNLKQDNVFFSIDADTVYKVPSMLNEQKIVLKIKEILKLNRPIKKLVEWDNFIEKINNSKQSEKTIAIIGKYISVEDAYLSIIESIKFSGYELKLVPKIEILNAEEITEQNYLTKLQEYDGIIVAGGFGPRGIEGKILGAKYARENKIPYLGLCLGLQVAAIEFARNVLNLKDANSTEFNPTTKNPVISLLEEQKNVVKLGGTMRLGNYLATLEKNTKVASLYKKLEVEERHRHRYEFNNKYLELFKKNGFIISGIYKKDNLVEFIELKDHPFFIASQAHVEFTSKSNEPNPLFYGFVKAVVNL